MQTEMFNDKPKTGNQTIYVYFTESSKSRGNWKIGDTRTEAERRVKQQQTGNDEKLIILEQYPNLPDWLTDHEVHKLLDLNPEVAKCDGGKDWRHLGDRPLELINPIIDYFLGKRPEESLPSAPKKFAEYPHQSEALEAISVAKNNGAMAGRVIIPTGGGKTYVEAKAIERFLAEQEGGTFLVIAPRIALVNQLEQEYKHFIKNYKVCAHLFHSGGEEGLELANLEWNLQSSTTDMDVLKANIEKNNGKKQIIFSTYDSCGKLADILFDAVIADESQFCTTKTNYEAITSLAAKFKLFFTATEKHIEGYGSERGLNNEAVFGQEIYKILPRDLIAIGVIIEPVIDIAWVHSDDEKYQEIEWIREIAIRQDYLTQKDGLRFSKILFCCDGTKGVQRLQQGWEFVKEALPSHKIMTISSVHGGYIDGVKVSRRDWMLELKKSKNAVIGHHDILAEGIDVDGITGVVLMRNIVSTAKILQIIGRAVRPYKPNPKLKTEARITVPVVNGDEENVNQVKRLITALLEGGFESTVEKHIGRAPTESEGGAVGKTTVDNVIEQIQQELKELYFKYDAGKRKLKDSSFWQTPWENPTPEERYRQAQSYIFRHIATFTDQNVLTPMALVQKTLEDINTDGDQLVCYNPEIAVAMHVFHGVPLESIYFYTECPIKARFMGKHGFKNVVLEQ